MEQKNNDYVLCLVIFAVLSLVFAVSFSLYRGVDRPGERQQSPTSIVTPANTVEDTEEKETIEEPKTETKKPKVKQYKQGTYLVGSDIEPGLYKSDGGITYLERLSGLSGELHDIIANEASPSGQIYIEIKRSDEAFKFTGAGTFYRVPGNYSGEKLTSFGDGWYIVGEDILPGRYRSEQGAEYYVRLSGFSGELGDIISNDVMVAGSVIVEISGSDVGFQTRGAQWVKID